MIDRPESNFMPAVITELDHAVHAYKVASVARMAMETAPDGRPTIRVLDVSIREGVRAALAAAMSFATSHRLNPIACRRGNDRIAVYVGAAYQFLTREQAAGLRDQLTAALEQQS